MTRKKGPIKTEEEIEILAEGGKRLAAIMGMLIKEVRPSITTKSLDILAERLIRDGGDKPSFFGYTPHGSSFPYPASLCVSVNDEVVHGIPGDRVLSEGDIVGLDLGLKHKGLFVDMAVTVPVGDVESADVRLIQTAKSALFAGIQNARSGNTVGDISEAIESEIKQSGFSIVRELGGHGVGYRVHEEPFIPNFKSASFNVPLREGMVLALEPMVNMGKAGVYLAADGYTYKTKDGKKSSHFEHTIVVTVNGPRILTA